MVCLRSYKTCPRSRCPVDRNPASRWRPSYQKPHLIILDEPTNNLDLESCEALASAIENFKGGVVLVSHDQYFVERVAKEVLVIEGGVVKRLDSFAAYKNPSRKSSRRRHERIISPARSALTIFVVID